VVHFAGCEVRVLAQGLGVSRENQESKTTLNAMPLSDRLPMGLNDLRALIANRSIRAEFQPIVSPAGNLHAFEILGRGDSTRLPREPYGLFRIAESMPGLAIKLSEIMRECGITQALEQSDKHRLFVNTHPLELGDMDSLLSDMERLRGKFPKSDLVLEVHEDAVTDPASMQRFGHALKQLDIALAFDDFGSGQARLLELVDVPIAYVKFDISMIRGLDRAPDARRHLVRSLVGLTASMGIMSLAEGVETRSELSACAEAGFELIQGFIFARPSATMAYSPN
jgi:EAL domain-containing protein (putative c-di-GMP-specific phosphodiesterase class I)